MFSLSNSSMGCLTAIGDFTSDPIYVIPVEVFVGTPIS